MDEIVKQAMAKWPNVPHCYGWLALDARGGWRMRDERAQALGLAGDRINNAALLGFINRNYTHDERGRWYFQNGPQRVYVDLEATPFIARTDPAAGFLLHTGTPLPSPQAAWLTEDGQLVLAADGVVAMVDDRDMAQCLPQLHMGERELDDESLLGWLDGKTEQSDLNFAYGAARLPVQRLLRAELPARFGFAAHPEPDPA